MHFYRAAQTMQGGMRQAGKQTCNCNLLSCVLEIACLCSLMHRMILLLMLTAMLHMISLDVAVMLQSSYVHSFMTLAD